MQKDLDEYLRQYNHERPHQGHNMNGRSPYQALMKGIVKTDKEQKAEVKNAA